MKKFKHDPKTLDLWENRARKFQLLRDLHFVTTPAEKLMLCILELTIGNFRELRIPIKTLAERCILSEKRAYAVAEQLRDEGLIKYIPKRGKAPLFQILWHWVDRLHNGEPGEAVEGVEDEAGELLDTPVLVLAGEKSILAGENSVLAHKNSLLASEKSILAGKKPYIRSSDSSLIESLNLPSTPSSSSSFEDVVLMVTEVGVVQDEATVAKALSQGLTLDQIRDVVSHYAANPGRWSAGVLVNRLTRPGAARLAPDQGWYGERPEWLAQRKRAAEQAAQAQEKGEEMAAPLTAGQRQARDRMEAMYGPQLDAMTPAELAELLADMPILLKMMRKDMNNPHRPTVLAKLQARDAVSREDRERRERMAQGFPPIDDFDDEDGSAGAG